MSESTPTSQGPNPREILELTHGLQQDLRAAQAKLTTIRSWLAAQPSAQPPRDHACPVPHCRVAFATAARLAEHVGNVHGDQTARKTG